MGVPRNEFFIGKNKQIICKGKIFKTLVKNLIGQINFDVVCTQHSHIYFDQKKKKKHSHIWCVSIVGTSI